MISPNPIYRSQVLKRTNHFTVEGNRTEYSLKLGYIQAHPRLNCTYITWDSKHGLFGNYEIRFLNQKGQIQSKHFKFIVDAREFFHSLV